MSETEVFVEQPLALPGSAKTSQPVLCQLLIYVESISTLVWPKQMIDHLD